MQPTINPFYQAMIEQAAPPPESPKHDVARFAKLPQSPITASPVPHLTSLYHNAEAGNYGNRSYPGNCGGNLIKDLLLYFRPANVFDPFSGSATCTDVCKELGIPCQSLDIRFGQDACAASSYPAHRKFDFIWSHPPYWRMKVYINDYRDLSQQHTLQAFLERYQRFIAHCQAVLAPGGKFAVLIGDYHDREAGFVPLVYWTKRLAFDLGLRQHCTDIVRFNHGASSSRKVYGKCIPGLHDVCIVFEHLPPKEGE